MPDPSRTLVISYLHLRKFVGIIGITFPFVLVLGRILFEERSILGSISSYYHSIMGDVFVGSLFAIGIFLLAYQGYDKRDAIAGDLACVFAIGTAIFPTAAKGVITADQALAGKVHLFFAACMFLTLAYFAVVLFRKTNPNIPMTPRKKLRNMIYLVCGIGILACLGLIALVQLLPTETLDKFSPVFWLESLALLLFGISWFVKGEAILKDQ